MSTETPCDFFFGLNGKKAHSCKNPDCKFSHDPESLANVNRIACDYHFGLNGKKSSSCTAGKKCPYSHNVLDTRKCFNTAVGQITAAGILFCRPTKKVMEFYVITERGQYADPGGSACMLDKTPAAVAARNFETKARAKPPKTSGVAISYHMDDIKYHSTVVKLAPGMEIGGEGEWLTYSEIIENIHPRLDIIFQCLEDYKALKAFFGVDFQKDIIGESDDDDDEDM